MLTISSIQSKITPKLNGTTIDKLSGFYEKCREAAGTVLMRIDPLETIRSARIENAIYSHIYNYAINSDVKGNNSIIDIRPYGNRSTNDDLGARFSREFDIKKNNDTFAIEVINGVKSLKLSKRVDSHTVLHTMDSLTLGGTITASGDVTDLDTNTLDFLAGSASVQFGLSGATGTGTINIALNQTIDLTDIEDIGALFFWQKFVDASRLTSVQLRWGSSSGDYWYKTITAPHDRSAFETNAWTLQRGDWSTASEQGTPVVTAVDYVGLVFTYSTGTALANNRLDNITCAKGRAYEALYYSDKFFKSSAGTFLEIPTATSDTINIAIDGENIFIYELMLLIIQEQGQKAVKQKASWFWNQLHGDAKTEGLYEMYASKYPSQAIVNQTTYHDFGYFGAGDTEDND